MRALSLTQPWASLMAWGEKRYETRAWRTEQRGEVAIVASKGFPRECRELCQVEPFRSVLAKHGVTIVGLTPAKPNQLPLGVVVALVDLVEVVPMTPEGAPRRLSRSPVVAPAPDEESFGDYGPDRFTFVTRDLRPLRSPVPVEHVLGNILKPGGALGFYTLSPACEAAVRANVEPPRSP